MDLEKVPLGELDALLDDLGEKKAALNERARAVMAVRNRRLAEEHAALHGLTAEEYAAAKAKAGGGGLTAALRSARTQRVKAGVAEPRVKGKQT
jgi:hypothetical protein